MGLHFSSGRVLLKSTDNLWYYVNVNIVDGEPYLQVAQDPTTGSDSFDTSCFLTAPDGTTYKFYLTTVDGAVYHSIVEQVPEYPPLRLFVKGTDSLYYEVFLTLAEGQFYLQLARAGTNIASIESPWRLVSQAAEDTTKRRLISPALARGEYTIITEDDITPLTP